MIEDLHQLSTPSPEHSDDIIYTLSFSYDCNRKRAKYLLA